MSTQSTEEDPLIGTLVLGRYRVVQPLARGGMGMIYLARLEGAAGFSKPVVIKQVLSHLDGYEEARSQFIREARILSELHHPGIVGVLDFGEEASAYVMALEYVHGFHLGQWLRFVKRTRGKLNWEFAVYAILRVLEAVHYAHTRTNQDGTPRVIIHRDISPGNILIDQQGNVRLLDFGIARAVGDKGEHQTREGVVKGKLSYIAPEIYGSAEANPSTDVYAVGVVLYQLLTGKNPFVGKDMSDTIGRVLSGQAPPLHTVRSDISKELSDVVATAIAKDPALRFGDADEFSSQLAAALDRRQSDVAADFRASISADFEAKLPKELGLAPLSVLDAAWRKSGPDPRSETPLLQSSLPPTTDETSAPVLVPPNSPLDPNLTVVTQAIEPQSALQLAARATQTEDPAVLNSEAIKQGSKGGNSRIIIGTMIGASIIAAAVAVLVLSFAKQPKEGADKPRYLLVERPGSKQVEPAPSPSPPPVATTEPAASVPEASAAPVQSAAPTQAPVSAPRVGTKKTGVAALTQAFSRKAGAVQGCFSRNAGALQGSPKISVRFEVSASGAVKSASLSPSSLGGTSLGQCLLRVARSTKFPSGEKAVAFSIPITARVVKN